MYPWNKGQWVPHVCEHLTFDLVWYQERRVEENYKGADYNLITVVITMC